MIEHAGISDRGNVRERNEDFIAYREPEDENTRQAKGVVFVVCDGVGGSGAGDVASREAAGILLSAYYESGRAAPRALRDAFERANLTIYDLQLKNTATSRMQTTLSAIAIVGRRAFISHVGDSRIYRIRAAGASDACAGGGAAPTIVQLTEDHSEVRELIRMKIITPEAARHHPRRHIITRSLGSRSIERGQFRSESLLPGDIFLLCSDGLWEPVTDAEMAEIASANNPACACQKLVDLALERGSTDNVSVQIARVDSLDERGADRNSLFEAGWTRLYNLLRRRTVRR